MIILTSYLDLYNKDENGERIPHNFGNENGILDILKTNTKKFENFLFVAGDEDNYEITDMYANLTFESFKLTLSFESYQILDGRTKNNAKQLVEKADFIFLCGGHLPTQNKFFNNFHLKELLKNSKALIVCGSAGSMNCADVVYCPPELEGEAEDENFKRYLKGLGFTNINILPHFDDYKELILDGKRYIEDIILPDSYATKILAISDGSFVVIDKGKEVLCGEGFYIENGIISKIENHNLN